MIPSQSRYSQGVLTRAADAKGIFQTAALRTTPAISANFTLYVWQTEDRPDIVAAKKLGNPQLWWAIFDINPEIFDPLNVPTGTVVRIPLGPVAGQGTLFQ
jgi:hypothetical protein